jgi:hypothetical protein
MPEDPRLSVLIATYNARATIGDCLRSLRAQGAAGALEVILADSSTDGTAELVAASFPEVRILRSATRMYCGDARNRALRSARAPIVALLDADCEADPSWAEEILQAHGGEVQAVGGAIANAEPANLVAWAAYFCEFSAWMPGGEARWTGDVAGAGMSYRKSLLEALGPFLEGTYSSDTELHWRMERQGIRLRWEPRIRVTHKSIGSLTRFVKHELEHGRYFGRVRARARGWPRAASLLMGCAGPLIAAKLFGSMVWRNVCNPVYLPRFLAACPLTALGIGLWTAGECTSYWGHLLRRTSAT